MNHVPVIIAGAPRSGTNMLRDVLAGLEGFHTWPCDEINFVWKHGNLDHPGDDLVPDQVRPQTTRFVLRQFQERARSGRVGFVVEKTCANSLRLPFVHAILPEARYVCIVRDGRDAVVSAMKRWRNPESGLAYLLPKFRFVAPGDRPRVLWSALRKRLGRHGGQAESSWGVWGPDFPELRDAIREGAGLLEVCTIQWAACVSRTAAFLEGVDRSRWIALDYNSFVADPRGGVEGILHMLGHDPVPGELEVVTSGVRATSVGKAGSEFDASDLAVIARVAGEYGLDPERPLAAFPQGGGGFES